MTADKKSILPTPFTFGANFGLSWQLVGVKNIVKALLPILIILTLIVISVPISLLLYLNAQQDAKIEALYAQVNSLKEDVRNLQEKCKGSARIESKIQPSIQPEKVITELNFNANQSVIPSGLNESLGVRKSRAVKKLIKCPERVAAKQFRGNTIHFIPSDGYVTDWKVENWCENQKIDWDPNSGNIEVLETGVYQLNAQLTFLKFNDFVHFEIQVQAEGSREKITVAKCRLTAEHDNMDSQPRTCSTSSMLCLNKNDRIFIFVPVPNVSISLEPFDSYIGLARLYKLRSCPSNINI